MWRFKFEGEYEEKDINASTTLIVNERDKEIGINCTFLKKEYMEQIKKVLEDYKDYKLKILGISFSSDKDIDFEFFCEYAKDVEKLRISDLSRISFSSETVEFLKCFSNVKSVTFFYATNKAGIVDFKWFPKLEELEIDYWKNAKNVFEIDWLKRLKIRYYPYKDLSGLSKLKNLEQLELFQANRLRNFKGSENLKNLKRLGVWDAVRLESLEGIEKLKELEELCMETCGKPKDISILKNLKNLKLVHIDKIKSVKPLSDMKWLKYINFDIKIEDSDVSVIFKLPEIETVRIPKGLYYSNEEIYEYIRERNPKENYYVGKMRCYYI